MNNEKIIAKLDNLAIIEGYNSWVDFKKRSPATTRLKINIEDFAKNLSDKPRTSGLPSKSRDEAIALFGKSVIDILVGNGVITEPELKTGKAMSEIEQAARNLFEAARQSDSIVKCERWINEKQCTKDSEIHLCIEHFELAEKEARNSALAEIEKLKKMIKELEDGCKECQHQATHGSSTLDDEPKEW